MTGEEWMGDDFSLTNPVGFPKRPDAQMPTFPVDNYASFIWNSGEESE